VEREPSVSRADPDSFALSASQTGNGGSASDFQFWRAKGSFQSSAPGQGKASTCTGPAEDARDRSSVPSELRRQDGQTGLFYEDILTTWRQADGIDAFEPAWRWDQVVPIRGDIRTAALGAWALLAALAAQTRRLRLGVVVTSNRLRLPTLLANVAARWTSSPPAGSCSASARVAAGYRVRTRPSERSNHVAYRWSRPQRSETSTSPFGSSVRCGTAPAGHDRRPGTPGNARHRRGR
jgi:hypothetical protein